MPTDSNGFTPEQLRFMERLQVRTFNPFEDEVLLTKPKPNKISKVKQLDSIAKQNEDVFSSINKLQEEINSLEITMLNTLAEKYDPYIFLFIGRNYTLKGASEKTKAGNMNTLRQVLTGQLNNITRFGDSNMEMFTGDCFSILSRFIDASLITKEQVKIYEDLFSELYDYHIVLTNKKKEKKSLMGREECPQTVCEDYLDYSISSRGISGNTISGSVRFEPAFTTTVSRGSSVSVGNYIRPF